MAFVIAVIALEMATQTIGTQARLFSESSRERYATAWADSTLSALDAEGALRIGLREGVLPGGYRWRLAIAPASPLPDDNKVPVPVLYRIDVTVSWPAWIGARALHLQTLKLATVRPPSPP